MSKQCSDKCPMQAKYGVFHYGTFIVTRCPNEFNGECLYTAVMEFHREDEG